MLWLLPSRRILSIRGDMVFDFLQGLVTQDMHLVDKAPQYSLILNAKGRYAFDFFIIKRDSETYWLDVDATQLESLLAFLKRYQLRRTLSMDVLSLSVAVLPYFFTPSFSSLVAYADSRLPHFFQRFVVESSVTSLGFDATERYRFLRYCRGVLEATEIPTSAIPFLWGFDSLHAISYTKGCYLGQELTHGMKHRDFDIREGLLLFSVYSPDYDIKPHDTLYDGDTVIGTVVGFSAAYPYSRVGVSFGSLAYTSRIVGILSFSAPNFS